MRGTKTSDQFTVLKKKREMKRLFLFGLLFLLLPLTHLMFRLDYYGLPLPNTFYAKLGGNIPDLFSSGLPYLSGFLTSGGIVLVIPTMLVLFYRRALNWIVITLLLQVIFQFVYVVRIGGDYLSFHRFLVPVIPAMAVLAAVGLTHVLNRASMQYLAVLLLVCLQTVIAYNSYGASIFSALAHSRQEREQVAAWLQKNVATDAVLATNAAGVIPYRTKLLTIDMLGLNDRHIASTEYKSDHDGVTFIGHHKHDGIYVCNRAPDVVLTSGAVLFAGRIADEAISQSTITAFAGDWAFLRHCGEKYTPVAEELSPGKYLVVYMRKPEADTAATHKQPVTSKEWFNHGIEMMQNSRFSDAIAAFETAHDLAPDNPSILTNLGFVLLDMNNPSEAIDMFKQALDADIILFGELHNNPICHWLQLELSKDIFTEKGSQVVFGAEMFERDGQLILDEYTQGVISTSSFESQARLWPNYETDYKPLVEFAEENSIPFIAINVPRRYASVVFKKGFEGLDSLDKHAKMFFAPLPIPYDPELPGYQAMLEMGGGMGGHGSNNFPKALAIITDINKIKEELAAEDTLFSGELILGASNTPGVYIMPRLATVFKSHHPEISFEIRISELNFLFSCSIRDANITVLPVIEYCLRSAVPTFPVTIFPA